MYARILVLTVLLCCMTGLQTVETKAQLTVAWATYLGGSGNDEARDLVVDQFDNVYVCGVMEGPDVPPPQNVPTSFDQGPGGFLASFSPDGKLRWLQYFSCCRPHELALTPKGTLLMAGQGAEAVGVDGFVALFNTNGERVGRDYTFDGSKDDIITSIDVQTDPTNGAEVVYVAGITNSEQFPVTDNAPQRVYQGGGPGPEGTGDGFVAILRIAPVGSLLQLVPTVVTYFGGPGLDEILTLRVGQEDGKASKIYIGGRTRSSKLPAPGILQPDRLGGASDDDGFVACLDASTLEGKWMMFLGALGNQAVHSLQTESVPTANPTSGNRIRVAGVNNGSNFPWPGMPGEGPIFYQGGTALGGDVFYLEIQERFNPTQNITDAFVARVSGVASTADDVPGPFARTPDTLDRIVMFSNGIVTSAGPSTNFNAYIYSSDDTRSFVREYRGNADECILDAQQARFGFGGFDAGPTSKYFCGSTTSTGLPGTTAIGPIFQRNPGGGRDAYIVKLGCGVRTTRITASDSLLCATADSATLTVQPNPQSVQWDDGSTSVTRVVRGPGTYKIAYTEPNGCQFIDSITIRSGSQPSAVLIPADTVTLCDTSSALIRLRGSNIATVEWSGGEVVDDTTIRVRQPGRYAARLVSADGCVVITDSVTVVATSLPPGVGVALTSLAVDSVGAGDTLGLLLRIVPPPGSALTQLPTEWSGRLRVDRSVLLPLPPLAPGVLDDSLRTIRLQGSRASGSDTLAILFLRAALGVVDSVSIDVDSLTLQPCGAQLPPESIVIRLSDICREGGTRLVSTSGVRLQASIASNPIGSAGGTATAVGTDASNATASIISVLGTELSMTELQRTADMVQWHVPSWLPVGRYILVVRSGSARTAVPFEVIR
ncbi:MAG: hypothetical protein FGM24_08960 [Candidatus Kapabacteria bacterium]|nr:hypothetical protein [Candidatus Kapabacteria bacterium]